MNNVAEIGFRLLNTVVLLILTMYLVNRFLISLLCARKKDDEEKTTELEHQLVILDEKHDKLQASFCQESIEWEKLKQKIVYWNGSLEQMQRNQTKLRAMRAQQMYEKKLQVQKERATLSGEHEIAMLALDNAAQELSGFFADQQRGQQYIAMILKDKMGR